MKHIRRQMGVEHPEEEYYAVLGRPVPVTVNSLDEACLFVGEMCSDILEPCRDLERPDSLARMATYAGLYSISLDDFMNQVNALESRPRGFEKIRLGMRKKTVQKKLEALLESLSVVPPLQTAFQEIISTLNLKEVSALERAQQRVAAKAARKENVPTPPEPLRITNDLTRRYIADYLVDAIVRTLDAKKILDNLDYAALVRHDVSQPDRRLRFKMRSASVLAAAALATGIALPVYLHRQNTAAAGTRQEVAAFQESLQHDNLGVKSTQYLQRSNALLEQIKDFKEKDYWLSTNITANFYVCYKKLFKDTPGLPPLQSLDQLRPCIDELQTRIAASGKGTVDTYLDNFSGFSTIIFEKVEQLRTLEQQLEAGYQRQLTKIEKQEKQVGYSLQDLRANVQAAHNGFGRGREKFHLQFAVEMSPLEFYALALTDLEFRQQALARGYNGISTKMFRTRSEGNQLGAILMNDYIALESVDAVKPEPFWKSGGHFDNGTVVTHNLHGGWK